MSDLDDIDIEEQQLVRRRVLRRRKTRMPAEAETSDLSPIGEDNNQISKAIKERISIECPEDPDLDSMDDIIVTPAAHVPSTKKHQCERSGSQKGSRAMTAFNEHWAAVQIQRICRGFLAQKLYTEMLWQSYLEEEEERREMLNLAVLEGMTMMDSLNSSQEEMHRAMLGRSDSFVKTHQYASAAAIFQRLWRIKQISRKWRSQTRAKVLQKQKELAKAAKPAKHSRRRRGSSFDAATFMAIRENAMNDFNFDSELSAVDAEMLERQRFLDTLGIPKSDSKPKRLLSSRVPKQILKKFSFDTSSNSIRTQTSSFMDSYSASPVVTVRKSSGSDRHDETSELDALMEDLGIA